jgi:hypothetical protein
MTIFLLFASVDTVRFIFILIFFILIPNQAQLINVTEEKIIQTRPHSARQCVITSDSPGSRSWHENFVYWQLKGHAGKAEFFLGEIHVSFVFQSATPSVHQCGACTNIDLLTFCR